MTFNSYQQLFYQAKYRKHEVPKEKPKKWYVEYCGKEIYSHNEYRYCVQYINNLKQLPESKFYKIKS